MSSADSLPSVPSILRRLCRTFTRSYGGAAARLPGAPGAAAHPALVPTLVIQSHPLLASPRSRSCLDPNDSVTGSWIPVAAFRVEAARGGEAYEGRPKQEDVIPELYL